MPKIKRVLVLHHSHIDIGYTERQEKIEWDHIEYIRQVLSILRSGSNEKKKRYSAFRWNCENLWAVEKFLQSADRQEQTDFINFAQERRIGISGNYLNSTDLIDGRILHDQLSAAINSINSLGIRTTTAMTADVNGYGWGYTDILYENGIRNLLSCVHTHHGMYPLRRNQQPFIWISPKGNELLVWNGEHYFIGNELGLSDDSIESYIIRDGRIENKLPIDRLRAERVHNYLDHLERSGYAFDFVPVTVSGFNSDNAPPNPQIVSNIEEWNSQYGDSVVMEMATIDDLFDALEKYRDSIPKYSGDWTDWWADGVGSTPLTVKQFRQAQRKYNLCKALVPSLRSQRIAEAAYNINLYAEHTWGYSASVSHPWKSMVNLLESRKNAYAINADAAVSRELDEIAAAYGATPHGLGKELYLLCKNPHTRPMTLPIQVPMEHLSMGAIRIYDPDTGVEYQHQIETASRGYIIHLIISLAPGELKRLKIDEKGSGFDSTSVVTSTMGLDGIHDLHANDLSDFAGYFENDFFQLEIERGNGIRSLIDKRRGRELTKSEDSYAPWTPIYERTQTEDDQRTVRRRMGRNRKAMSTTRIVGQLIDVRVEETGPVYTELMLEYSLTGTSFCAVSLRVFNALPLIFTSLQLHKESIWDPENLYLTLPFTTGDADEELWIDKTGAVLRPRIDQLPGSCTDFYSVQQGAALISDTASIFIGLPDTPLITLGSLDPHPIRLSGDPELRNRDELYAWVMNNFWETNFKASLGGFHEYQYTLSLGELDPQNLFAAQSDAAAGFMVAKSFPDTTEAD